MNYAMPTGKETYQLLVSRSTAVSVAEEWAERAYPFDLRLRRAKTHGMVVIEVKDVLFASRLVKWYGAKVNIKQEAKP